MESSQEVAARAHDGSNRETMWPSEIIPEVNGARAAEARLSPDGERVAFWAPAVGEILVGPAAGEEWKRVYAAAGGHVAELAWSGDGRWLAFTLTSGPPPGDVRVVGLRVDSRETVDAAGMSFAWA